VSRRCFEAFRLSPDNPLDVEESDLGPISTTLQGLGRADLTAVEKRIKVIQENPENRKRKCKPYPDLQGRPPKLLKPSTFEDKQLAEVKRRSRRNCAKLRVVLERLPQDHPKLRKAVIDLPAKRKATHLLPIPATVRHVFADVIENIEVGTVQTKSETSFAVEDFSQLGANEIG
jgi:hypothetical protein